jgi:hypothetical protein
MGAQGKPDEQWTPPPAATPQARPIATTVLSVIVLVRAVLALVVIGLVGWLVIAFVTSPRHGDTTTTAPPTAAVDPTFGQTVLQTVLDGSGVKTTDEACSAGIGWVCSIDWIEPKANTWVRVHLKPQEVWRSLNRISTDYYVYGKQVSRNVINFAQAGHVSLERVDVLVSDGSIAYEG